MESRPPPEMLDELELLDYLLKEEGLAVSGTATIPRRADDTPPPLSFAQQRLWVLWRMYPRSPAYTIAAAVRLSGLLDIAALKAGLNEIVRRHEVLRTGFETAGERPVLRVLPSSELALPVEDLSGLPEAERRRKVREASAAAARRIFAPGQGALIEARLLRLADTEHVALLSLHHLVADAWSMGILVRELGTLYSAYAGGQPSPLPELPIQYGDFSAWQRRQEALLASQLDYWKRQLAGLPVLDLPKDRPRPATQTFTGASLSFTLPPPLGTALKTLGQAHGASLFMTLLAAFQVLLHRYTEQTDIVVGTPIANRHRREVEPLIGFFVNTLVLRGDLSGRPGFRTVLERVRDTALAAFEHQDLPFEHLVQALLPERDLSHNPLFQVMFTLQTALTEPLELAGLTITPLEIESGVAKFDLTLAMTETPQGLVGGFEYNTDLFEPATIARLAEHFKILLEGIVAHPEQPVVSLPLLSEAERRQVSVEWNATTRPYPDLCIHEAFAAQAAQTPAAVALLFEDQRLSYAELDRRANRLARYLRSLGVGPDGLVGLCVERSLELGIALLGILKAGGAYVPLDPDYPPERLAFMLEDTRTPVLLTHSHLQGRLPPSAARVVCLDREAETIARFPAQARRPGTGPENLAYVSYTSGSTGRPKGVAVTHRSVLRLVKNTDYASLTAAETFLQLSPVAFDASTLELWGSLLNGARLVILPPGTPSLEGLGRIIREHQVSILWLTAGLFHVMVDERLTDLRPVRQLLAGGDVLSVPHVQKVLAAHPHCTLINGYGPTENTTFSCCYPMTRDSALGATVPIGRPIANSRAYLLDGQFEPVPIGVPGELYVTGVGLARGYLNRPELTAEKFIPDPYSPTPGGRLYRTGDRARWLADGGIEFLGRLDEQVKIRGFRIEPAEIAVALTRHPKVRDAVILAREDRPGQRRLTAYVCPQAGRTVSAGELRAYLQERLPDYMVPAYFVLLETLPITPNGKLDRRALPPPDSEPEADGGQEPRTPQEQALAQVWQAVLGRERIDRHANYFELGGDSISAIQMVSRLHREGWRLEIQDLFRNPTIAGLAPRLRRAQDQTEESRQPVTGQVPLIPVQDWFFAGQDGEPHHFNQAALLACRERLDEAALRAVLSALQRHHDALRLVYRPGADDGTVVQYNQGEEHPVGFTVQDLRAEPDETAALAAHAETVQRGFDLARGPLFKAVLYRRRDGDRLLLVAHHLVVDGVSWRILLEDLERGYRQYTLGEAVDFGPKTVSFKTWTEVLIAHATDDSLLAERDYWAAAEAGPDPLTPILILSQSGQTDQINKENRFGDCESRRLRLPSADTAALLGEIHHAYHTEVQDILLTALGYALKGWWGGSKIRLLLEGHGREPWPENLDLSRTVGWFTSLYPFVLEVAADQPGESIKQVKEDLRRIPRKGIGYGILTRLTPQALRRNLDRAPWPSISFNYLGQFGSGPEELFRLADEPCGQAIGPSLERHHELDLVAAVVDGHLEMTAVFHPGRLVAGTVERFLDDFQTELQTLIEHCRRADSEKTPADFSVPVFSLADYAAFLQTHGWRARDIDDIYPLSPMQAGLLFEALLEPASQAYCVQIGYRLRGELRPDFFRRSWALLCRRHPVLRTAFVHEGLPQPLQVVLKERPPEINTLDLRELTAADQETRIAACREQDRRRGFDLHRDPLLRITVLTLAADRHHVIWSYHHILLDGWCMGILHGEFSRIYRALTAGREPELPPAVPYGDYIRWLQAWDRSAARDYWSRYLAGYEQLATLPGKTRSAGAPYQLRELEFELADSAGLRALAARFGATLSSVVQSLWGLLLAGYNDTDDVVFGAVVSGRPARLAGVETMIGLFINAVPVRLRSDPEQPFSALLQTVQERALASEPYHYYPLAEIQSLGPLGRELFDHLLIFENFPLEQSLAQEPAAGGLVLEELRDIHDRTHYDFDLMVVPAERIRVRFHYNGAVYGDAQMQRTAAHLQTLAQRVLENPEEPVSALSMLPAWEWEQVVKDFNRTAAERSPYPTVVDWFEAQAAQTPDAVALVFKDQRLSYRELNERANRLAHGLREVYRIGAEDRVGLLLDRSDWLAVAVLGILKAGGAYVPIDPGYPPARIRSILEDSGCAVVLSEAHYLDALPRGSGVPIRTAVGGERSSFTPTPAPDSLAYILYTSGSTGRPKGCQVEHRNLVHYLHWADRYYFPDRQGGSFPLFSPLSFDLTITSLFLTLLRGRTLHIFPQQAELDDILRESFRESSAIDSIKLTPAHISLLPYLGLGATNIRLAIVGGEALTWEQVRWLQDLDPALAIYNEYGPTETTVGCIVKRVTPAQERVLIGRPIDNTRIYIVDRRLNPVPIGVPGEILIAGAGVCRGYRNREDLNREKFLPDPFDAYLTPSSPAGGEGRGEEGGRVGERLYRTGDLGRWLESGDIDFLGRSDDQLKIRGYRVEPGEIEHWLRQHPAVQEALVMPVQGELAAYVTGTPVPSQALRDYLAERLPEYMVPAQVIALERFPLTDNGKVDRRALPPPDTAGPTATGYTAPRDPLETRLAAIWQEVLGHDRIGIHDDFFGLGGHSLKAMQVVSRIHKERQVKIPLRDFFQLPTIATLAGWIRHAAPTGFAPIEPTPAQEDYVLSHAQQRLWLEHHLMGTAAYNMPEAFLVQDDLDSHTLNQALTALMARHEILRTAFVEVDGEPRQRIHPPLDFAVREVDLRGTAGALQHAREIADREAHTPFALDRPPLFRVTLIRLDGQRCLFLLNMHHIIGDGWSRDIFYRELLALYEAGRHGLPDPLRPLRIQYKDYAVWQSARGFAGQERYWLDRLAGAAGRVRLPYDFPPQAQRALHGGRRTLALDAATTQGLQALARRHGTTLATVMLALFKLFLFQLSRQDDLCVGMGVANRDHPDLENLIGCFVNILPIRTRLSQELEFAQLLEQVMQSTVQALEHQDYPFDLLIARLNPNRRDRTQPFLNVMYGFQNFSAGAALDDTSAAVQPFDFSFETAKFDLTLVVADQGERLLLMLEYDSALLAAGTVEKYLKTLERFARMIAQ